MNARSNRSTAGGIAVLAFMLVSPIAAQKDKWEQYWRAARDAADHQQYAEAEKWFLAAIEEAEKHRPNSEEHYLSLLALADVYEAQGRWTEAQPLLRKVLSLQEAEAGEDETKFVYTLALLAAFYERGGRYVEADRLYERVLALGEKTLDPGVDDSLKNYAAFLRRTNRLDEAENVEARAAAIKQKRVEGATPEINEQRAVGALRTVNTAAITYSTTYGNGYPASLRVMGMPDSDEFSCKAAGLVDELLASGELWGYRIIYKPGKPNDQLQEGCPVQGVESYSVVAQPVRYAATGRLNFYTDDSGVIRWTAQDREATANDLPLEGNPREP